jgi:hypothetical protein
VRVKPRDLETIARIRAELKAARPAGRAGSPGSFKLRWPRRVRTASAVSQREDGSRTPKTWKALACARVLERVSIASAT